MTESNKQHGRKIANDSHGNVGGVAPEFNSFVIILHLKTVLVFFNAVIIAQKIPLCNETHTVFQRKIVFFINENALPIGNAFSVCL